MLAARVWAQGPAQTLLGPQGNIIVAVWAMVLRTFGV